jgi:hypothetical protein
MVVEVLILNGLEEGGVCKVITREGEEIWEGLERLRGERRTGGMDWGRVEGGF